MKMTNKLAKRLYLPEDCKRVLCAVSGGADSMCLLHLCRSLRDEGRIELFAAHYEHGIRGEESERDAAFVAAQCEKLGVELRLERGNVPSYAAQKHMGLEEAARELRYAFLQKSAAEFDCDCILTAHNADDNAETLLFNLSRGSGSRGLRGIPRQRGNILRPMLDISRSEIEAFLEENGLEHVEDSSNASDDYSRNLIRHHVMPVLRRINPDFSAAAARTAGLLERDEDLLSSQAAEFIKQSFDGESVALASFNALHPAIASRALRALVDKSLSYAHVEAALDFAKGSGLGYLDLPGCRLRREQGKLWLKREETEELPDRRLIPGQKLFLPEAGVEITSCEETFNGEIYGLFKTYLIKCESISGNIYCTSRRPGDRIRPQGRNCSKTLKSLFMERGFTQTQRRLCPVIRDEAGVLIVPGIAAAERCRAQKGDRVLKITIKETEKE